MNTAELKHRFSPPSANEAAKGVRILGRLGIACRGIVYLVVGFLTVRFAFAAGGEMADARDALGEIGSAPFGRTLLTIVGAGLIVFGIYRLVGAWKDIDGKGSDGKAIAARTAFAIGGLIYGSLGVAALGMVFGGGGGGGGGNGQESMVANLLGVPAGRWLVGLLGIIIAGYGLAQLRKAVKRSFFKKFRLDRMSDKEIGITGTLGTIGIAARAIVLGLMGYFVVRAAIQFDSSEAGGLQEALAWIGSRPYGPWLLAIVAGGLFLYGLYTLLLARYRQFLRHS